MRLGITEFCRRSTQAIRANEFAVGALVLVTLSAILVAYASY